MVSAGRRPAGAGHPVGVGGTNFCTSNADAATEFMQNYVQALIDGPYRGADVVGVLDARRRQVVRVPAVQGPGHAHRPEPAAGPSPRPGDQAGPARGQIHRPIAIRFWPMPT